MESDPWSLEGQLDRKWSKQLITDIRMAESGHAVLFVAVLLAADLLPTTGDRPQVELCIQVGPAHQRTGAASLRCSCCILPYGEWNSSESGVREKAGDAEMAIRMRFGTS